MPDFETTDGQTQVIIPLRVTPHTHKEMPTITGSIFSHEAGTVFYGNYNMEYLLPGGDRLRLIANHNKKTVQLMLFTHNPELLKILPGGRPSSLVADVINHVNRYKIQAASYKKPLSHEQEEKINLANACIRSLNHLLKKERQLKPHDHAGQEELRRKIISIIEHCQNDNRMIANNPVVSEGSFGYMLYDAHKTAQHYRFNRVFSVSRQDQMDFTKVTKTQLGKPITPCFVWDSEIHIGHSSSELDDALRVICQQYQLCPAPALNNIPANRFAKLERFISKLWHDGRDWINYLAIITKPGHKTEIQKRSDGVSITKITPYYKLKGLPQRGYNSLAAMVNHLVENSAQQTEVNSIKEAKRLLSHLPNGNWVIVPKKNTVLLRLENKLVHLKYFIHDQLFYPLPDGEDLYILSQISKRHLYLPERISLRFKAFISRIPDFFKGFYKSMSQFIIHGLHEEFFNHVHATHAPKQHLSERDQRPKSKKIKRTSLHEALQNQGFLANGQTLEEFISDQINNSPYVIARANHPPTVHTYENPLHRALGVVRHLAGFFIDTSERNPMIGTLAMAAYIYGAGAVLAPNVLADILKKLHLSGLIYGIEPVQKLAHLMNHGKTSEAISASVTLWQGMVVSGNLDKFFVDAVSVLKEDPAEIAIIVSLALSLGYGLTKAIPSLQHEMGDFPYTNYAALGGKGGAAIYDTIMHPGDDWFLGTCKWFCKNIINIGKLLVAPFFEGFYYGFFDGFINGWKKSGKLIKQLGKQTLAASVDLILAILTIPLLEVSSLLIHVPFRGITNFFRKLLSVLGNFSAIGKLLIDIAERPSTNNFISEFTLSPLYGFTSPFGHFSDNPVTNIGINGIRLLFLPLLQLIKNILILPLIDTLSLTIRINLSIINPISRLIAYSAGTILYHFGQIWDHSAGVLFSTSAYGLTTLCNHIDSKAGELKQYLLSLIEINRGKVYQWAFHDEDILTHKIVQDNQYYFNDPRRCELIPHSDSHCLLRNLLLNEKSSTNKVKDDPKSQQLHFPGLFHGTTQTPDTMPQEHTLTI